MNGSYRLFAIATTLLILAVFQGTARASEQNPFHIGFEQQVYRTGIIPGIRFERGFAGRHSVHLRLGYHWVIPDSKKPDSPGGRSVYDLMCGLTRWTGWMTRAQSMR